MFFIAIYDGITNLLAGILTAIAPGQMLGNYVIFTSGPPLIALDIFFTWKFYHVVKASRISKLKETKADVIAKYGIFTSISTLLVSVLFGLAGVFVDYRITFFLLSQMALVMVGIGMLAMKIRLDNFDDVVVQKSSNQVG